LLARGYFCRGQFSGWGFTVSCTVHGTGEPAFVQGLYRQPLIALTHARSTMGWQERRTATLPTVPLALTTYFTQSIGESRTSGSGSGTGLGWGRESSLGSVTPFPGEGGQGELYVEGVEAASCKTSMRDGRKADKVGVPSAG